MKTANAAPLCILRGEEKDGEVYVFYVRDGETPDYRIRDSLGKAALLTLSDREALHASKAVIDGKEYLFISDGDVILTAEGQPELILETTQEVQPSFKVWPALPKCPKGFRQIKMAGKMYRTAGTGVFAEYVYEGTLTNPVKGNAESVETPGGDLRAELKVSGIRDLLENGNQGTAASPSEADESGAVSVSEVLLKLRFAGDTAELICDGKLVADQFYTGQEWEIGLMDLLKPGEENRLTAVIHPLTEESRSRLYLQTWPEMRDGKACRIEGIETAVVYRIALI